MNVNIPDDLSPHKRVLIIIDPQSPEAVEFMSAHSANVPRNVTPTTPAPKKTGLFTFFSSRPRDTPTAPEPVQAASTRKERFYRLVAEGKILLVPTHLKHEWERACRLNEYRPGHQGWDIVTHRFFPVIKSLMPDVNRRLVSNISSDESNYLDELIQERFGRIINQLRIEDQRQRGLPPQDITVRPEPHQVHIRPSRPRLQDD